MKINKRIGSMFLCLAAMVLLLTFPAFAQGEIDLNQKNSLSLTYKSGETCLAGAGFRMYKIADADQYGVYTTSDAFKDYPVDMDLAKGYTEQEWKKLASTLTNLVSADTKVKPDAEGKTDAYGKITMGNLQAGIYLVVSDAHTQGGYVYTGESFLAALPSMDNENNSWIYEAVAEPKFDSVTHELTSRNVLKVWKDSGYTFRRPSKVTVELLGDGKVYDSVELSEANGWTYTWDGLDSHVKWTLTEKNVPNKYTVSITQDGKTFVVTNTTSGDHEHTTSPSKSTTPSTPTGSTSPTEVITDGNTPLGVLDMIDENQIPLGLLPQTGTTWWLVAVLTCASVILFTAGVIRYRSYGNEKE